MDTKFFVIRLRMAQKNGAPLYVSTEGMPGTINAVTYEQAARYPTPAFAEPVMAELTTQGMTGFLHPVVKYENHEEDILEEAIANTLAKPTHELLRAAGPRPFIIALADSFPALRHKVDLMQITPGSWDVDLWMKNARNWSHAERQAALFVAMVWNYSGAISKKWRFDAVDALSVWDGGNRGAFINWAANPVWP